MAEPLRAYRRRRDFAATPEPAGDARGDDDSGDALRFVVHEHHARRLHWDLRLERDGVLVSWAVPKGIPPDPRENRLAVHTEDHPLEYLDFAGEIPAGSYGAGTIAIWDRGTYTCHKFRDDEVIVTFHGERLTGRYALFQTDGTRWMIHRMDPPADPARAPLPEDLRPMLARAGGLPADDEAWGYEVKWDGVRALAWVQGGRLRLRTRTGRDVTSRYPEVAALGPALGAHEALLDGELVAFDPAGRPSFELLQRRMHLASDAAVRRAAGAVPVVYVVFDLLHLDGESLFERPYVERRARLAALGLDGPAWRVPAHHVGDGSALLDASRQQGLEGIVAKRLDSAYRPARRSPSWLKVKNRNGQELVIGGWVPGAGGRAGRIGALLVGHHDVEPEAAARRGRPQRLRYAGRVGSGLAEADLDRLAAALEGLRRADSPFDGGRPPRDAVFVEPRLVCEVEFTEWTRSGTLRHPVFGGIRDDKDPADVVREPAASDRPPGDESRPMG